MGIGQSIFTCLRSKEEDEQQRQQQLYPFLDNNNNYKKPYNGASFGLSSFCTLLKNLLLKIFPFAKSRKPEPILPVVNPINNPPFLQIQDSSSSSSDSSSSPITIYTPGCDLNLQLQSDHYSSSEDEVHANATTTTWLQLQKAPVCSAMERESNESSSSSDSSSSPNTIYTPGPDLNFQLQSDNYSSSYDEVGASATASTWPQKPPISSAMERESNESSSSSDSSSIPNTIYTPGPDLDLQLQSDHCSSSEDELRASATTTTWLQKPPVSSAMETESNESSSSSDSSSSPNTMTCLDYQSLASTNTFDVVDSAIFSIKKKENEVEEFEEAKVMIDCCVRFEGKWITHYNSYHRILLVGEGDFSLSASLAVAFGYAPNMIATSLDSLEFLQENYSRAMSNIEKLRRSDCTVKHGIDAKKIASHDLFGGRTFDRIVFNFPFAGFFKELPRETQLRKHRRLVSMFLKNAKELIDENGEIHITHKTNDFHKDWMLESLASCHGLRLIEAVDFNRRDYKGYKTKRGFGGDDNFNCHPSKTYKFGLKRGSRSLQKEKKGPQVWHIKLIN